MVRGDGFLGSGFRLFDVDNGDVACRSAWWGCISRFVVVMSAWIEGGGV